ncbi:hypothetical protein ABK040_012096 [Willaertia magna]
MSFSSDSNHNNNETVLIEGYFHKQGKGVSGLAFKRRFFKLYSNRMDYLSIVNNNSKNNNNTIIIDNKINGTIHFNEIINIKENIICGPQKFQHLGISLITKKRTFKICFEEEVMKRKVLEFIKKNYLNDNNTDNNNKSDKQQQVIINHPFSEEENEDTYNDEEEEEEFEDDEEKEKDNSLNEDEEEEYDSCEEEEDDYFNEVDLLEIEKEVEQELLNDDDNTESNNYSINSNNRFGNSLFGNNLNSIYSNNNRSRNISVNSNTSSNYSSSPNNLHVITNNSNNNTKNRRESVKSNKSNNYSPISNLSDHNFENNILQHKGVIPEYLKQDDVLSTTSSTFSNNSNKSNNNNGMNSNDTVSLIKRKISNPSELPILVDTLDEDDNDWSDYEEENDDNTIDHYLDNSYEMMDKRMMEKKTTTIQHSILFSELDVEELEEEEYQQQLLLNQFNNNTIYSNDNNNNTINNNLKEDKKKKRIKDMNKYKEILYNAIKSKDINIIENAIKIVNEVGYPTIDKLYQLCLQQLQKIKQSKIIQESLEKSFQEQDLRKMRLLLKEAENYKPYLTKIIQQMTPKYIELVNLKLFKKKIENSMKLNDLKLMKKLFNKAIQVGLNEEIEKYKKLYDLELQKENIRENINNYLNNNDGEGLRHLLLHAKSLNIENEFIEIKNNILPKLRNDTRLKRKVKKLIENYNLNNNNNEINKIKIEYPNLNNYINEELNKIEQRKLILKELNEAINKKDKIEIEKIIKLNRNDDQLDLSNGYKCLELIKNEREQEKLAAIYKLEETLDQTIMLYDNEPTKDNELLLINIINDINILDYKELYDLIDSARNLIQKKKIEENRRIKKILAIKYRLQQGIKERDIDALEIVLEEGPLYFELQNEVKIAKEMLEELYLHTHVINTFVDNTTITTTINSNDNDNNNNAFEDYLKSAHQSLGNVEKSVKIKFEFEECLEKRDLIKISKFIHKNKHLLNKEELDRSSIIIEELTTNNKNKSTTLLDTLHLNILNILNTCDVEQIDKQTGRYIITLYPFGEIIVKNIMNILNYQCKRIYWIKDRSPYDTFKNLNSIQQVIREFEALDLYQELNNLNDKNLQRNLSILLIQYLLEIDYFVYAMNELLLNDLYLNECYEKNSYLVNIKYRDELLAIISLLNQFDFKFNIVNNNYNIFNFIILNPILQLKQLIKSILQYFYLNRNNLTNNNRELDILIKKKLSFTLMDIFLKGFKSFSLFKSLHIWNLFEDASKLKKLSAVDIGGIGIPTAIESVNKIIEELQLEQKNSVNDLKFRIFICYALNENQLSYFIQSILREDDLINNYYDKDALIRDLNFREKMIAFLSKLDLLPFQLNLTSELL